MSTRPDKELDDAWHQVVDIKLDDAWLHFVHAQNTLYSFDWLIDSHAEDMTFSRQGMLYANNYDFFFYNKPSLVEALDKLTETGISFIQIAATIGKDVPRELSEPRIIRVFLLVAPLLTKLEYNRRFLPYSNKDWCLHALFNPNGTPSDFSQTWGTWVDVQNAISSPDAPHTITFLQPILDIVRKNRWAVVKSQPPNSPV